MNGTASTPGLLGDTLAANGLGAGALALASGEDLLVAMDSQGRLDHAGDDVQVFGAPSGLPGLETPGRSTGRFVRDYIVGYSFARVQVIVLTPTISPAMEKAGDELPGIIMAEGAPADLFPANGPLHTLTSTTTRRYGLVSNEDVAPTILNFFDIPIPSAMKGAPITVAQSPPPFELHQRHILARQRRTPIAVGVAITTLLASVIIFWCSRRKRAGDQRAVTIGAWLALSLMTLPMALLAAGTLAAAPLPMLVLFIGGVSLGVPAVAMVARPKGRFVPPAIVGAVVLLFYFVDSLLGSNSQLTTFLGSQGFDGGRYFGMHNVSLGLILGSALFIAGALKRGYVTGAVVLAGAMLLIGLPWLGTDNGGSVTLAFALGMWIVLKGSWRRPTISQWLVVGAITVAGAVVVLVADVLSPEPTHGARFVEVTGSHGVGAIVGVFTDRLGIGLRLLVQNPTGVVYLALLPVLLFFIVKPRPRMQELLAPIGRWRAGIAVMLAASVVAYFANDTGVSASGLGVASAVIAWVYASLTEPEAANMSEL